MNKTKIYLLLKDYQYGLSGISEKDYNFHKMRDKILFRGTEEQVNNLIDILSIEGNEWA